MKRIITLICICIGCIYANAQLKYVAGSFKSTNASDIQMTETDLGKKNMTSTLTPYAGSHNDSSILSGIIRVTFKNVANEDIDNHMSVSVQPGWINKTEYIPNPARGNMLEYWVHLDAGNDLVVTLTMDGMTPVRIPGLNIESGKMYTLEIESAEMVPVTFGSNLEGTTIIFDGTPLGGATAPGKYVKKDKTTMGRHHIKAKAGNVVKEMDIDVSKANTHFMLDMLRRYNITFQSNEPGVMLYENGKELGIMPIDLEVTEGAHTYTIHKSGYSMLEYPMSIKSDGVKQLDIHKNKTIDFYAVMNNNDYTGASVYINNNYAGITPLEKSLAYGKYKIRMSANGRDKTGSLTVNDNTSSKYMLTLPAHHKRFNPFAIDYHQRSFGFTVAYVQKWMHISDGRQSIGTNYFGEEKHMHGVQIGVPIQPIFGYGLGLNTGLYFECYFDGYEDYEYNDHTNMEEYCLYMPIDLMFRLPLGENFSIFVNGGIGIDWSIETVLKMDGYDDYKIDYSEEGAPNHFNFSGEMGGGIQYKSLQVSANYQIGLTNNSNMVSDEITAKLRKFSIQLSLMF